MTSMKSLRATIVLVAGFLCSGFFISLPLIFAAAAAGNSGQTSLFTEEVLPITIGVIALWIILSSVLLWRGRMGWAFALAWGPALIAFLTLH